MSRYLKDDPLLDMHDQPLIVEPLSLADTLAGPQTIGSMVTMLVKAHNNQSGLELSVNDYRVYAQLEDVFGQGSHNGWYKFEEVEYELLLKMVTALAPKALRMEIARNSPVIVDMLKDASRHAPTDYNTTSPNGHQAEVEVGASE